MNVAIVGLGKMGRAVESVLADSGHRVVARFGAGGCEFGRSLADGLDAAKPDVAIEFTRPDAAAENLSAIVSCGTPVVCGTTGWDTAPIVRLADDLGVPVMIAPNFSIGVAMMRQVVARIAQGLASFDTYQPGIFERHHAAKLDKPSGTARMLATEIAQQTGVTDVPIAALRQGAQPGEHTVYFEGLFECLSITHQVRDRKVFALGAVRAAEWLVRERPRGAVTFTEFMERTESCVAD